MGNYNSKLLSNTGLTSSEANYTANIVKELSAKINSEITQMSLFRKTLLFNGTEKPFNKQYKVEKLDEKCLEEGKLYALAAWLREGIKVKNLMVEYIQRDTFDFETLQLPMHPAYNELPTLESIKNDLPVDELAEFIAYEAKAAHIGRKVHPGGVFETWFAQIRNMQPIELHPTNKDYIIETALDVDTAALDELFFKLQQEYREAEQKVNYFKAKIQNLLNEELQKAHAENQKIMTAYNVELEKIKKENEIIASKIEAARSAKLKDVSELKIIIPHALQSTLEFVQTYSKKKK